MSKKQQPKSIEDKINWKTLGKVLVCIDAANLEKSVQDLGWWVNYRKLKAYFRDCTSLQGIRFYSVSFGNARHNEFLDSLRARGFRVITKPLKVIKDDGVPAGEIYKANFDVEIAVDAMDKLDNYSTLVLFSGDSDFDYLVKRLQQKNKKVIVISTRFHMSHELAASCNNYIDLRDLKRKISRRVSKKEFL